MEFSQIVLNFREKHILKLSSKHPVEKCKCERLLRLKLVYEIKEQSSPGWKPTGTGMCEISENGIDYLLYRKDLNRSRFTIPIIVSIITTLLLNGIIWSLPRLLSLLQQLILHNP